MFQNCFFNSIKPYLILIWLLLTSTYYGFSQALEANHWYFGYNASLIFQPAGPKQDSISKANSTGSVAAISNNKGVLQFYVSNDTVYTKSHSVMMGGQLGYYGKHLALKAPSSSKLYYLLTMVGIPNTTNPLDTKCRVAIIDMSRNGGFGRVISKSLTLPYVARSGGVTLLDHENGFDKWLVLKSDTANRYDIYKIDSQGIGVLPSSQIYIGKSFNSGIANIKSSPDSRYIAVCSTQRENLLEVLFFDNRNGTILTSVFSRESFGADEVFSCAFTPNSHELIVSRGNKLLLYSLPSNDSATISRSELQVASNQKAYYDLQLALDGNIYFIDGSLKAQQSRKISRIRCPDNLRQNRVIEDTIIGPLGNHLGTQLPTLNQTLYVNTHKLQAQSQGDTVLCKGDSTELTAYGAATDDFYWSPSNGLSCTNCQSPMAAPDTTTTYRVIGIARSCAQDNVDTAYVTIYVNPPKGQGSIHGDTVGCGTQPITLNGPKGFDNYWWLQGFPGRVRTVYAADTYKLRVSSKCYTDTLTHVVRYEDSLQYTFPNDTTICASDFPITLTAQSNFGVRINLAPQTQVTFTESNSAFFETSNHCTRASKTVRVDTIVLPSAMPDTSLPDSIAIGEQLNLPINGFALQSGELRSFSPGTSLQYGTVGETQLFQVRGKGSCTDTVQLKSIVFFEPEVPEVENVPCEMSVSPNPGSESFELLVNQELQNIGVYDARGRAVYVSEEPRSTPLSMFSERWSVGTYFIQATCKDETVLRIKWVKR